MEFEWRRLLVSPRFAAPHPTGEFVNRIHGGQVLTPRATPVASASLPALSPVTVELRAARIPVIGWFAWHHWFVLDREGVRDRWEVWQTAGAGGLSWRHLHCNLLPPERGVGSGPSWVVQQWHGRSAAELAHRLETSPSEYPFCDRYRYWPGPNSNTYVQWILGVRLRLCWRGCGRGYSGVGSAAAARRADASDHCRLRWPPLAGLLVRNVLLRSLNP